MGDLLLPVRGHTGMSSWAQHQRRNPRSSEPGTDLFVPHGTPVYAPADGRIWGAGWDIDAATGRWVGIDFTNGLGFRCMHHSDLVRTNGLVERGELIAYSGSSGYGSEFFGQPSRNDAFWRDTGGDHTHITLWPDRNHRFGYKPDGRTPYTIDFMEHVGGAQLATSGAKPFTPSQEEDDMFSDADRAALNRIAGLTSHAIRDTKRDSIFFVDEFGADHVLDYKSDDIELGEFLGSLGATFGVHEVDARTFDIAVAIASRRWTTKVDAIATATAAKVAALVSGKPVVIDPMLIRQAVESVLSGVEAVQVDAATIDRIANRVADVQHERLAS